MSDPKPPSTVDLTWLPAQSAEEWHQLAAALRGLRLMVSGLGMRHTLDEKCTPINRALAADIAALQAALQRAIDHAMENASALGDLAKVIDGQPPAEPSKALH